MAEVTTDNVEGHQTSMLDWEVKNLVMEMRKRRLATDQMAIAIEALQEKTLTCRQGGQLLGVVTLGIMQRKLALEVLHIRLNDLPDGLPDILAPLGGEIAKDVSEALGGGVRPRSMSWTRKPSGTTTRQQRPSGVGSSPKASPGSASWTMPGSAGSELVEPMDRLRRDVCHPEVPDSIYDDVSAVFKALGLEQLPPRESRGPSAMQVRSAPRLLEANSNIAAALQQVEGLPPEAITDEYLQHLSVLAQAEAEAAGFLDNNESPRSHASEESV